MSFDPPVLGTGISVITDRLWSLGVFYQRIDRHIDESKHLDGVWTNQHLTVTPVAVTPLASVTYNSGKEIRVYYLDTNYIVQEYGYSEGRGWFQGEIGQLKAKAGHSSGLAAVVYGDDKGGVHLRVYYQADSHVVAELANDGAWHHGELNLTGALPGTNLAAVAYNFQSQSQIRLYYQAADLSLKEHGHNNSGWFAGGFNPGKAESRTPLSALAYGDVELQVYWRNTSGHIVYSKNTGSWSSAKAIPGLGVGRHFAVLQWENGKRLRLYYQGLEASLAEYYSDNSGESWAPGEFSVKGA